ERRALSPRRGVGRAVERDTGPDPTREPVHRAPWCGNLDVRARACGDRDASHARDRTRRSGEAVAAAHHERGLAAAPAHGDGVRRVDARCATRAYAPPRADV